MYSKKKIFIRTFYCFQKSRVPKVVQEEKSTWDVIADKYSQATKKVISISQLKKILIKMKSHINKKKTDLKETEY